MIRTLVIGAGPAGMLAAITAAAAGETVTVLEHLSVAGKKILSTGNGHCNLTNRNLKMEYYHSRTAGFYEPALRAFDDGAVIGLFEKLGIMIREKDGYCYPRSMQASTIRTALENEMLRRQVLLKKEQKVTSLETDYQGSFLVKTLDTSYEADRVILASGGMAAPVLGSDGSGYQLAQMLGHTLVEPLPALTGLILAGNALKKASGVRTQARVELWAGGQRLTQDTGELQITDYGISGIPVFQISSAAGRALLEGEKPEALLDFLPEMSPEEAEMLLKRLLSGTDKPCIEVLNGLLPDKLCTCILKTAGIQPFLPGERAAENDKLLRKLLMALKALRLPIQGTSDFTKAQVTSGGISGKEVDPVTMESRICPGLYFAGEILDVDGICGGYNLQWAFSSGYAAGRAGRKTDL